MADNNSTKNMIAESLLEFIKPENFQKYILGTTKKGHQRSLYDIINKQNKKRRKNSDDDDYPKKHKKKKKKSNKKNYKFNGYYKF